jgi:hypothetical protein
MIKCPQCFSTLGPQQKAWVCASSSCAQEFGDPVASAYAGYAVPARPMYVDSQVEHAQRKKEGRAQGSWPPPNPPCPNCTLQMVDACTVCHFALPPHWSEGDVTCVVMSGARASGKSLYIAMGIDKLERLLLTHASSQLQPFSPDVAQIFRVNYQKPLDERGVLQSTPKANNLGAYQRQPLIFDLGNINRRRQYLVLRDVAGEDMEELPPERTHFSFFGRADAVLFLFDPLAVPDVRASLAGNIPLPPDVGHDPVPVVGNVLRLVREGSVGQSPPPIGVVVSKFDALEEFRNIEEKPQWSELMSHRGAAFARDPSDRALAYDTVDGDLLSAEIRSLILKLGGNGIVAQLENPSDKKPVRLQYFAVSVLGHSPRGDRLDGRGIAPFRAVDPLKWALSLTRAL